MKIRLKPRSECDEKPNPRTRPQYHASDRSEPKVANSKTKFDVSTSKIIPFLTKLLRPDPDFVEAHRGGPVFENSKNSAEPSALQKSDERWTRKQSPIPPHDRVIAFNSDDKQKLSLIIRQTKLPNSSIWRDPETWKIWTRGPLGVPNRLKSDPRSFKKTYNLLLRAIVRQSSHTNIDRFRFR